MIWRGVPRSGLRVDSRQVPFVRREKSELKEKRVLKFDIPLGLLPAIFPPRAGEWKWATGFMNLALVGTGEKGEWVMVTTSFFGGNIDGNGWTLAFKREMIDR